MDFKKYNSIDNSYRNKTVSKIQMEFGNHVFIVQEKIHGANFSICYDGKEFKYASRNDFLEDDNNFNNYKKIKDDLESAISTLFQAQDFEEIRIYGELFGGSYPHPDVPKVNTSKIQKGVFYHPDVKFRAFDMYINGKLANMGLFVILCREFKIPFIPVLYRGSLEDCLKFPNDKESEIHQLYKLPKIEDNIMEGVVIKTVDPCYFGNGSRAILKNKNEKFTEKAAKGVNSTPEEQLSETGEKLKDELLSLVTENRLRNVLSKIDQEITMKSFGMLMGLMNKDAKEEFNKDFAVQFEELGKSENKRINRNFSDLIASLIRKNIANIIDGEF